jgi:hypothetical protein
LPNAIDIAGFEIDSLPILANDVSNLAISNTVLQFPWKSGELKKLNKGV